MFLYDAFAISTEVQHQENPCEASKAAGISREISTTAGKSLCFNYIGNQEEADCLELLRNEWQQKEHTFDQVDWRFHQVSG